MSTRVIVFYGCPGVGKLTIAKRLAAATGFPLLHNHLVLDMLSTLFGGNSHNPEPALRYELEYQILEYVAHKRRPGIITTFAHDFPVDNDFDTLTARLAPFDVQLIFIQLIADKNVVLQRVTNTDRQQTKKLVRADILEKDLAEFDVYSPYTHARFHTTIDTSELTAEETFEKALAYYQYVIQET